MDDEAEYWKRMYENAQEKYECLRLETSEKPRRLQKVLPERSEDESFECGRDAERLAIVEWLFSYSGEVREGKYGRYRMAAQMIEKCIHRALTKPCP